jgi:hypothetical protein
MERVLSRTVSGLKVASMTTAYPGRHLLGLIRGVTGTVSSSEARLLI